MDKAERCDYFARMPEIDLGPDDYRKQGAPKSVRQRLAAEPRYARNMMIVALIVLGYIFWRRTEVTSDLLFGITAMFAACAGALFAIWLKDVP